MLSRTAGADEVAAALQPDRLKGVTSVLEVGIETWGAQVLETLGSSSSFDMRNPLIKDYLDSWREQSIVGITRTTRDDVTAVLKDAAAEGVGVDEMRRRLKGYFNDAASYRAERIARTEVISSSNAANLAAYQISGLVEAKEWLAVQDENTRESHSEMDGQRALISEEFVSPRGQRTQGPGLFGVAAEDINCRCTVRPVLNDAASPQGEERAMEWRAYIAGIQSFERDIFEASWKAFMGWLSDALEVLG